MARPQTKKRKNNRRRAEPLERWAPAPDDKPLGAGALATLEAPAVPPPQLDTPTRAVRIDLACGQTPREGFEGLDLLAPAARKVDLLKFPWPLGDNSVDELHCSHFVEHIPCREIEARDLVDPNPQALERWLGVDLFFAFFDEAWRVLKHEGRFRVICPALQSVRAFQDPTHRRFIPRETFAYLWEDWRKVNKLDHYRVRCNFAGQVNHTIPAELSLLDPEAQVQRFATFWNQIADWIVDLVAIKEPPKT